MRGGKRSTAQKREAPKLLNAIVIKGESERTVPNLKKCQKGRKAERQKERRKERKEGRKTDKIP